MAILFIPSTNIEMTNFDDIKSFLGDRNVWHDRWETNIVFSPEAEQPEILAAYAHVLNPYMANNGYKVADVIAVHPNTPNLQAIRDKFNREHTHTEDEVRFFVDGIGYFWFNLENTPIFCLKCMSGDLISVPAGAKHWFEMENPPLVKAIRIFIDPTGWVPNYTESTLDQKFTSLPIPTLIK